MTRKRFEQFGREIQGSLTRLDQHLDGGGLSDGGGRRKDRDGRELYAGSGNNGGMLTEEELEELELNTQALRRLSCSVSEGFYVINGVFVLGGDGGRVGDDSHRWKERMYLVGR